MTAGYTFASDYVYIEPDVLNANQTLNFMDVNETSELIFGHIKTQINTKKYPKYFLNYALVRDDGTQSKAYHYVKYGNSELIYTIDTNELKYISFRRPELQKNRILYEYPSGKLYAVQIFSNTCESFMYSPEGRYVDYSLYVRDVQKKVKNSWKVPERKKTEELAKGQKDLLVQTALFLNKDGSVKKILTLKSSKIKDLDENANEAIKNATPFKPFPENFFNEELIIILNFNFSL